MHGERAAFGNGGPRGGAALLETYFSDPDLTLYQGVARQLGRHAIGVELNERYCAMTRARPAQLSLLAEASA